MGSLRDGPPHPAAVPVRAVVVGSGPNGLSAAIRLAQHGVEVTVLEQHATPGGGMRSGAFTLPGLLHDHCSAVHPMGLVSPFFQALDLASEGLQWAWPEIDVAHPFDDAPAALLWRDVARTADGLGEDGRRWRQVFGPLHRWLDDLAVDVLRPIAHVPSHPLKLAAFGAGAMLPATALANVWRTPRARALFTGVAAHLAGRLDQTFSASVGLMLTAAAHAYGWPVAVGGSQSIANALVAKLRGLGGTVETGVRVGDLADLGGAEIVLLDLDPAQALTLLHDRLPDRVRRAYRSYPANSAAFKLDLAVEGGIPWRDEAVGRAGTVH